MRSNPPPGFFQTGSDAFSAAPSARAFDATKHLKTAFENCVQVKRSLISIFWKSKRANWKISAWICKLDFASFSATEMIEKTRSFRKIPVRWKGRGQTGMGYYGKIVEKSRPRTV